MTVAELIEILKPYPSDAIVTIESSSEEYAPQHVNSTQMCSRVLYKQDTDIRMVDAVVLSNEHDYGCYSPTMRRRPD